MTKRPLSVLFLCTQNSARSQMAEALLRHLSKGQIDVVSAGSAPQPEVHPLATATLRNNYDIDPSDLYPKPIGVFRGRHFDYVITVCDRAAVSCPVFPGDPQRLHWSFEDPASVQDEGNNAARSTRSQRSSRAGFEPGRCSRRSQRGSPCGDAWLPMSEEERAAMTSARDGAHPEVKMPNRGLLNVTACQPII